MNRVQYLRKNGKDITVISLDRRDRDMIDEVVGIIDDTLAENKIIHIILERECHENAHSDNGTTVHHLPQSSLLAFEK